MITNRLHIPALLPAIIAAGGKINAVEQIAKAHVAFFAIVGILAGATILAATITTLACKGHPERSKKVDRFFRRLHGIEK